MCQQEGCTRFDLGQLHRISNRALSDGRCYGRHTRLDRLTLALSRMKLPVPTLCQVSGYVMRGRKYGDGDEDHGFRLILTFESLISRSVQWARGSTARMANLTS